MGNSFQLHDGVHLKLLPTLLEVFFIYRSYCIRKVFYKGYDNINKFSNFKWNLVSQFNKPRDTTTNLCSKNTFLMIWNSILNYNWSLIYNLVDFVFSVIPQSYSKKIQLFQLVNMINHSGLSVPNVLHEYLIPNLFFVWIPSSLQIWLTALLIRLCNLRVKSPIQELLILD